MFKTLPALQSYLTKVKSGTQISNSELLITMLLLTITYIMFLIMLSIITKVIFLSHFVE